MNIRKAIPYALGAIWLSVAAVGAVILVLPENSSLIIGIVVACLSLAAGLILANPAFLMGLIAGIGMIFLPGNVVGIIMIIAGAGLMISNLIIGFVKNKKA